MLYTERDIEFIEKHMILWIIFSNVAIHKNFWRGVQESLSFLYPSPYGGLKRYKKEHSCGITVENVKQMLSDNGMSLVNVVQENSVPSS